MYTSYQELVSNALFHSDSREKARIEKELQLFEKRHWENYILCAVNLLCGIREYSLSVANENMSVMDSVLVRKAVEPDESFEFLLTKQKAEGVLFHDALRLNIFFVHLDRKRIFDDLRQFETILIAETKKSSLQYEEELLGPDAERIVISTEPVSPQEKEIIRNERIESTEEEAAVLRKHFLLTLVMDVHL